MVDDGTRQKYLWEKKQKRREILLGLGSSSFAAILGALVLQEVLSASLPTSMTALL